MRRYVQISALLLAIFTVAATVAMAADRNWQTGTLISSERKEERGITQTKNTESTINDDGSETTKSTTTVGKSDSAEIYMYYMISNGKTNYLARQLTNAFFVTGVKAQPGDKIDFAVEGENLYVKRADGKESRLRLVRTSMASAPSVQ